MVSRSLAISTAARAYREAGASRPPADAADDADAATAAFLPSGSLTAVAEEEEEEEDAADTVAFKFVAEDEGATDCKPTPKPLEDDEAVPATAAADALW